MLVRLIHRAYTSAAPHWGRAQPGPRRYASTAGRQLPQVPQRRRGVRPEPVQRAELVDSGELLPGWHRAREADRDGLPSHQWTEGIRAAWAMAGPEPTAAVTRRAGLCAAQQVTIRLAGSYPETATARLDALVAVAGEGGLE